MALILICHTQGGSEWRHRKTYNKIKKHEAAVKSKAAFQKVPDFFKKQQPCNEDLKIAAKEATWAYQYHTLDENQSYRSNDCVLPEHFRLCLKRSTNALALNL